MTDKQCNYLLTNHDNHKMTGWTRNISNAILDEVMFQYIVLVKEQGQEPSLSGLISWLDDIAEPYVIFLIKQSFIAFSLDEFHKAGAKYV